MRFRVVGHIDGPAGDDGLLAPGAEHLVGRDQVEALGLFTERRLGLEGRKDAGLLRDQSRAGQGEKTDDRGAHRNPQNSVFVLQ